jgi:hypothetical protein
MKPDFVFYSALAVIGSFAIFFLVAALRRERFLITQKLTLESLDEYSRALPQWSISGARAAGAAGGFLLLVALTYSFDQLGNVQLERVRAPSPLTIVA